MKSASTVKRVELSDKISRISLKRPYKQLFLTVPENIILGIYLQ